MKKNLGQAYAQVDCILDNMDEKQIALIPEEIRQLFKEKKSKRCKNNIVTDIELNKQDLTEETKVILAVLSYNYLIDDEKEKIKMMRDFFVNENLYQEKIKNKIDLDE